MGCWVSHVSKLETVPSENLRTLCMACHEGHNGSAQMCHTLHCMLGIVSLNVLMSFFLFILRNNVFWFVFWSFFQERSRSRIIINWKKTKSKWQQILVLKKYQSPLILLVEYCLYSHFPRVILEFYKTAKKKKKKLKF